MSTGHHGPEGPAGPSSAASVVLDIGPHAGALVVYTPADLAGREIEIRPTGAPWSGEHTAVRERHVGGTVVHAGVFGSLPAGSYRIRLRPAERPDTVVAVQVRAGAVAEAALSRPAQAAGDDQADGRIRTRAGSGGGRMGVSSGPKPP